MAKKKEKNTVITEVYDFISVGRTNISDLARLLNQINARAINRGQDTWKPVGGPIVRDFPGVDLLITRRGELDLDDE